MPIDFSKIRALTAEEIIRALLADGFLLRKSRGGSRPGGCAEVAGGCPEVFDPGDPIMRLPSVRISGGRSSCRGLSALSSRCGGQLGYCKNLVLSQLHEGFAIDKFAAGKVVWKKDLY